MNAVLQYGGKVVADVTKVFGSEDTWYGYYNVNPTAEPGVRSFIEFSVDWNCRCKNDFDNPPDAGEFDRFGDLLKSGWTVEHNDGRTDLIEYAPVFFETDEVSWKTKD